jgi:hypothetical protein
MKKSRLSYVLISIAAFGLLAAEGKCVKDQKPVCADAGCFCEMGMVAGSTATNLGPQDMYAGYMGFMIPVKKGERVVFRTHYPHSRYMTIVLYDQDFRAVDAITDFQIEPLAGENPFRPGVARKAEDLGEFEVQVLMEEPPSGGRPKNTLYAGKSFKGGKNSVLVFGYRVYYPDKGFGPADGHPLGVYGGVPAPRFRIEDPEGKAYCPRPNEVRLCGLRVFGSIVQQNLKWLVNPQKMIDAAVSPPRWHNAYSRDDRRDNTYVGNEDTIYVHAPVSSKYGELLVLRYKPPRTPEATYLGEPFPAASDMRYYSFTFAYLNRQTAFAIYTERTVADREVPALADGIRQMVIGFNGMARPEAVPPEQWVGLKMKEGIIIVRYILTDPAYAGDLGKLPKGWVPPESDEYTPGGVYCSAAEFAKDPDIGLKRRELVK